MPIFSSIEGRAIPGKMAEAAPRPARHNAVLGSAVSHSRWCEGVFYFRNQGGPRQHAASRAEAVVVFSRSRAPLTAVALRPLLLFALRFGGCLRRQFLVSVREFEQALAHVVRDGFGRGLAATRRFAEQSLACAWHVANPTPFNTGKPRNNSRFQVEWISEAE